MKQTAMTGSVESKQAQHVNVLAALTHVHCHARPCNCFMVKLAALVLKVIGNMALTADAQTSAILCQNLTAHCSSPSCP